MSPLFDFLLEQVAAESSILYILERYVRRVEWFERDDLHARAMQDTRRAEEVYDTDLRRFLFSEGISMPFSQARSASGLSDVLTDLAPVRDRLAGFKGAVFLKGSRRYQLETILEPQSTTATH